MLESNLYRLIEASPHSNDLSDEVKDAIVDYYVETGSTLGDINVDDLIVNSLTRIGKDEYEEYKDDYYLLFNEADEYYILQ